MVKLKTLEWIFPKNAYYLATFGRRACTQNTNVALTYFNLPKRPINYLEDYFY